MKKLFFSVLCILVLKMASAQEIDSVQMFYDTLESRLNYQTGSVALSGGVGTFTVPQGFKYLDGKQSDFVLSEIWGNPPDSTVLGMLLPANAKVTASDSWAFIVTYDEMGFVKDDDADDIDYEELLESMRTDMESENEMRKTHGFEPIALIGWASEPFYDSDKKVLHWAKELKFGDADYNTLNYNVRILGRRGVLVLNAVGSMDQIADVKQNIPAVMNSFTFAEGNRYSDFDPDIDEVAAWTVGGLVAGKVLAKAGFFAIILKNIKLIGLAIAGLFTAGWKWYKRKTEPPVVRTFGDDQSQPS